MILFLYLYLLQTEHKGPGDSPSGELEELVKKADEVKVTVCQTLATRYDTLTSVLYDTSMLHKQVNNTLDDLNILQKNIQNDVSL